MIKLSYYSSIILLYHIYYTRHNSSIKCACLAVNIKQDRECMYIFPSPSTIKLATVVWE